MKDEIRIPIFVSELAYQRIARKRKIYRESSVSPCELEDGPNREASPLTYPSKVHPDVLNEAPDFSYKARFLYDMKLQSVPVERRKRESCQNL